MIRRISHKELNMLPEIRKVAEALNKEGKEVFCMPAKLINHLYWIEREVDGKVMIYSIYKSSLGCQLRVHCADGVGRCERLAVAQADELLHLRNCDGERYYVPRGHFFWGDWIKIEF